MELYSFARQTTVTVSTSIHFGSRACPFDRSIILPRIRFGSRRFGTVFFGHQRNPPYSVLHTVRNPATFTVYYQAIQHQHLDW
jgi:hypothetical protein